MSNCAAWKAGYEKRCLGSLTLLTEIEYARSLSLEYYYLGHIARVNPRCEYKTRFPGLELYDWEDDKWIDFTDPRCEEMIDLCLPEWHWELTPEQELEIKQALEEIEQLQKEKKAGPKPNA
jgi:arginyl-tRNA--protein-N-Asp/Glu arginylyltransferase